MTRARLIECVIAEWLERDGWSYDEEHGAMEYDLGDSADDKSMSLDFSVADLADTLDAELDRIIREAKP